MTQPCEEVCDLGGAGSGACETRREPRGGGGGFGGGVAVQWRCHLPDRDVTQVAGHREPAIELGNLGSMQESTLTPLMTSFFIKYSETQKRWSTPRINVVDSFPDLV